MAPLRGLPFLIHEGMRVALTPPALDRDRFVRVLEVSGDDRSPLVSFSCSRSLHDAESLAGCYVLAPVDELDLEPLDVAFNDLLGRTVLDERFGELGRIVEIMETPANDVWVVDGASYGEVLLPVIEDVVSFIPDQGPIPVRIMDGLIES